MPRPVLFSGTELVSPLLPEGVTIISPPRPKAGLRSVEKAVQQALEEPLDGPAFFERARPSDRVLIVFDCPAFPVPPMRVDPRGPAIRQILSVLADRGVADEQISLLCASGVGRIYSRDELAGLLGEEVVERYSTRCHDAEDLERFWQLGTTTADEPIELNAAVHEADLVITVSLVQAPLNGGYHTLVTGLASARTARALFSAKNLSQGPTAFDPQGSGLHKAIRRAGKLAERKLEIFHVELAIDTRMWAAPVARMAPADGVLPRALQAWAAIPEPLRARASRLLRADYQTIAVFAGSTEKVHSRILEVLEERCSVAVERQADVALLGVPAVTPHSTHSLGNPVLAASSAFGYQLAWHKGGPLFRKGGALIVFTPLIERFEKPRHLAYLRFYEEVLSETRDPMEMALEHELRFSGRPELVSAYRRRNAYHGMHPFISWYLASNTLARASKVFAVGAAKRPAERMGLVPVATLEEALAGAAEAVDKAEPSIAVPLMPPIFGLDFR